MLYYDLINTGNTDPAAWAEAHKANQGAGPSNAIRGAVVHGTVQVSDTYMFLGKLGSVLYRMSLAALGTHLEADTLTVTIPHVSVLRQMAARISELSEATSDADANLPEIDEERAELEQALAVALMEVLAGFPMETSTILTEGSRELFLRLAKDAENWSGEPLLPPFYPAERGNLTDLVRKGLITVFDDDGDSFASFTDSGRALAAELGVEIEEVYA